MDRRISYSYETNVKATKLLNVWSGYTLGHCSPLSQQRFHSETSQQIAKNDSFFPKMPITFSKNSFKQASPYFKLNKG